MKTLRSIQEFQGLQESLEKAFDPFLPTIVIPAGTCGQASGANDLIRVAKRELLARKLTEKVRLRITGCNGFCQMEPLVVVEPAGRFYPKVGIREMARIVSAAAAGRAREELFYRDPDTGAKIEKKSDIPFFRGQSRTLLSRGERIDPIRIHDYLENGGYSAFVRLLSEPNPDQVVHEVKASGLRGRGGAGFPTGIKWEMMSREPGKKGKVLICNADEGDPGAYMDRSLLEGNPHSILEGMLIGALATGAGEGVVYVRDEYPLAIKHLIIALQQAEELGIVGGDILGSSFSFRVEIMRGAGAFVCGEETALIRSIEGKIGEPRQKPPYPVQRGIESKPTMINNVETWANIPVIFERGAEAFRKIGAAGNQGTKIFSLVGKAKNTGLVEVPMGTTVAEIVGEIGGGPAGKAGIKAVQIGGPSGGCLPAENFSLPVDYDGLAQAGAIMGSGGMIVLDENTCMVDVARYYMNFLKGESCGKCFSCRKGTQRMHEILEDVCSGKAAASDLDLLEELAHVVKDTTMCGLGQTAPNPVLSTLRYFRQEYLEHVKNKRCPAGVCKDLVGAPCQSSCPLGTEAWRYIAHIQRGEYEKAYRVIREANPFPSVCARVCHHPCEERCRAGTTGLEPVAIRALKRFVTEHVPSSSYRPVRKVRPGAGDIRIAIVGAGPAGLTAAHLLSLKGYRVFLWEAEKEPGGMLRGAIPAYRLNREVLRKEIASLLTDGITLNCGKALGRDFSLEDLTKEFRAVLLATGAPRGRRPDWQEGKIEGVHDALAFLRAWNFEGRELARGRVGVIGGGNSAVDAARVARRQKATETVTILYRRMRKDMPAFPEEIEAALEEGIRIEEMVSPLKAFAPEGVCEGLFCIRNSPGERDAKGRRRPVPIPGSEHTLKFDTVIVAVGEEGERSLGIDMTEEGKIRVNPDNLQSCRPGVFAAGDSVTGPQTVVEAIAAGKKAARIIDRYLQGEELEGPAAPRVPDFYIPADGEAEPDAKPFQRVRPPSLAAEARIKGCEEVERAISEEEARREAGRCLRCDLEFTRKEEKGSK